MTRLPPIDLALPISPPGEMEFFPAEKRSWQASPKENNRYFNTEGDNILLGKGQAHKSTFFPKAPVI